MTGSPQRSVPEGAREVVWRLVAMFDRDRELVLALNEAQRRLLDASDRLTAGLSADALRAIYGPAGPDLGLSGRRPPVLEAEHPIGALEEVADTIRRAFTDYQNAAERRRQLGFDVGEANAQLVATPPTTRRARWPTRSPRRCAGRRLVALLDWVEESDLPPGLRRWVERTGASELSLRLGHRCSGRSVRRANSRSRCRRWRTPRTWGRAVRHGPSRRGRVGPAVPARARDARQRPARRPRGLGAGTAPPSCSPVTRRAATSRRRCTSRRRAPGGWRLAAKLRRAAADSERQLREGS